MIRTLMVCALTAGWTLPAIADDKQESKQTVVHFSGKPIPASRPALKYQLLPELREMSPGNPILEYLKCFNEQSRFYNEKESWEKRDKLLATPLSELPDLRDYGGKTLRHADQAARMTTPDWQTLGDVRSAGFNLLIPEVQEMRKISRALKLRLRGEVASHRLEEALGTTKTMFALARHLGDHPTVIADLVGIAIATEAFGALEELMQQPYCPNLYWALTNLPEPLVDMRNGWQGEVVAVDSEFTGLDSEFALSDRQLQPIRERIVTLLKHDKDAPDLAAWLDGLVKNEECVRNARQRLVDAGMGEHVRSFPALQIVLLDERRQYDLRRDEMLKWMTFPYWQAERGVSQVSTPTIPDPLLDSALLSRYLKVRLAGARLDRRVAMLRHVEALRLYAAEHDGKLPAGLNDCTVPLPVDPLLGKPFGYSVEGDTATLLAPPPPGADYKPNPRWTNPYDLRYVVTITK